MLASALRFAFVEPQLCHAPSLQFSLVMPGIVLDQLDLVTMPWIIRELALRQQYTAHPKEELIQLFDAEIRATLAASYRKLFLRRITLQNLTGLLQN